MAVEFDKTIAPSATRVNDYLLDPRELRPDPVLNGRVELPDIEKFKKDFRNPKIGQIQPITIKKVDGAPVIVDGVSRWRAALELTEAGEGPFNGIFKLQCRYFYAKNPVDYFIATIKANIRNEPKHEDNAHNVALLIHNFNMTEEDVAIEVYSRTTSDGKPDIAWVKECLAINDLTPEGLEALKTGKLKDVKAAVALSKLTAKIQREKLKSVPDGAKLTAGTIKRSTPPNGSGTAASAAALNKNGSDPLTVAEFRNHGNSERKIRTVSDFRKLVEEYLEMDIPERIKGFTCENAVRKILSDLLDELK